MVRKKLHGPFELAVIATLLLACGSDYGQNDVREREDAGTTSADAGSSGSTGTTCPDLKGPPLALTVPADDAHPCDGTNWWCDPAGVAAHCECLVGYPARNCGSDDTCNPGGTQTCTSAGKWGACSHAPQGVCSVGASQACATCSTFLTSDASKVAGVGSQTCGETCTWGGCRPTFPQGPVRINVNGNSGFSHQIGHANGTAWSADAGDPNGYLVFGPYVTLPAGKYHLKWKFLNVVSNTTAQLAVDVYKLDHAALPSSAVNVPCPATGACNTVESEWDFVITEDCLSGWEFRVAKNNAAAINVLELDLTYQGQGP